MAAKTPSLSTSAVAKLTSMLEEYTAFPNARLPGTFLTVSSTDPNAPLFLDAKGSRNITVNPADDPRGPVTPKTLLFIASCTKSIVAVSILLLIQEGRIKSLEESVDPYIPELRACGVMNATTGEVDPVEKDRKITIGMLLDHTSGSTYPFKNENLHAWTEKNGTPSAFTFTKAAFIDLPLLFQPGDGWSYGLGLDWAVLLIERLLGDGTTFSQFAKKRIFGPLGMKRTTFTPRDLVASTTSADEVPDEAKSMYTCKHGMEIHWREDDGSLVPLTKQFPRPAGGTWAGEGASSPDIDSGGAGIVSTIEDYGRYLSFLVSLSSYPASSAEAEKLSIPTALFIDPSISRQLFTPHLPDAQIEGLVKTLDDEGVVAPKGGYANLQHTYGLAYLPTGTEAGVTEGSVFWSGITCLFYFVDPKKQIAVMLATQILPYSDPAWKELLYKTIKVVYDGLE